MARIDHSGGVDNGLMSALESKIQPAQPPVHASTPAPTTGILALTVLYWSVALQKNAGLAVFESGRLLENRISPDGINHSVLMIPYPPGHAVAAIRALQWVTQWMGSPFAWTDPELSKSVDDIVRGLQAFAPPGKNTFHFLRAAHASGIPWDRIAADYYQYGWGARSRLMQSSFTDHTPTLGVGLARNKHLGAIILRRAGLPAPPHALAKTADEAVQVAMKLGYPVVVKPADLDGGVGVAAGLQNETVVRQAFAEAARHSKQILVEKHVHGQDYRLLVFDGRLIWTVLRQPGGVTGNGTHTIEQLIEQTNTDPRRNTLAGAALKTLVLDAEALELLAEQQLTTSSVPAARDFVRLRRAANIAMGGLPIAANTEVHPDNRRLAEQAAQAFGLDLAGIDLLIPDIAKSWHLSGAAICEVNAQPQFGATTQQHLHGDVLQAMLPQRGRIPTLVVLGQDDAALFQALCPRLASRGWRIGLATAHGAFIDDEQQGQFSHVFGAAQALLFHKSVDVLIIHLTDATVLKTGLPMDEFDVLLLASDFGPENGDALTRVFSLVSPHQRKGLLVNAKHPHCVDVARAARDVHLIGKTPFAEGKDSHAALLSDAVMAHLAPPPPLKGQLRVNNTRHAEFFTT